MRPSPVSYGSWMRKLSRRHHLAAKAYLRGFADADNKLVRHGTSNLVPIQHAAVEDDVYLMRLRDASLTDIVERLLGDIENAALPTLCEMPHRWPLERAQRTVVAGYIAVQISRTLDSLGRHARLIDQVLAQATEAAPTPQGVLGNDALRMHAMLGIARALRPIVTAMTWTLVCFSKPCLSTSDNPVGIVPIDVTRVSESLGIGVEDFAELWLPLRADQLLVLCWLDRPDHRRPRNGQRRIAESVNAAMRDQANKGWYWRPGSSPPIPSSGRIEPVAQMLFPGYGPTALRASKHRRLGLEQATRAVNGDERVFHPVAEH